MYNDYIVTKLANKSFKVCL